MPAEGPAIFKSLEVIMEKCKIPFVKKLIIVFLAATCMLFGADVSHAQNLKAYVSTQDGSKVFVYSLVNHQLINTIDIYKPTPLAQALPPNANDILAVGERIFLTVPGSEISQNGINEIKVIDSRSDRVIASIKTDMTPSGLLEHKGRIYVMNRYGRTIQEIDPVNLKIVRSIPFTPPAQIPLNNPLTMEIANDKIYLPFPGGMGRLGIIQILDLKTGTPVKTVEFGTVSPYGPLAIRKAGENKIYLGGLRSVGVLDTQSDRIIKNIVLSGRELYVQSFTLHGNKLYAANGVSTLSVIDVQGDVLTTDIDTGYHDYACHLKVGIASYENRIFVADAGRGIKIIDTVKDKLMVTIASEEPLGPVTVIRSK
jgi:DNA-binding beta-propeller fold protein YncE